MQTISILILIWIYSVSVVGFLYVFSEILGLSTPAFELSIFLSLFGVGLGFIFYGLSYLKTQIKNYAVFGIMGVIFLIILITYASFGLSVLIELLLLLIKIGFFLSMCSVPIIGVYAIMKKQKNALFSSAIGILFLYFFILIMSRVIPVFTVPFYSSGEILFLLLFFILFIMYLELGINIIYFSSVIRKMSPTKEIDEFMFTRFNYIVNRYLLQVPLVLILVYIISVFFFWNSEIISSEELFGIRLNSGIGIFLLVIFAIAGTFISWYLIPREKTKTV
jgi:hypothetical protein